MKSITVSLGPYSVPVLSLVPDSLYCLICSNILVKPHQGPCGCRFCYDCICGYLKEADRVCPGQTEDCGEKTLNIDRDLRPDILAKREVNKISVTCPLKYCQEECEFGVMRDHLTVCSATEVRCEMCGNNVCRGAYDVHVASECKQAIVQCESCQTVMTRMCLENEHHNYEHDNLCLSYEEMCPDDCGEREKVVWREHRRVCINTRVSCPYHVIGCTNATATMVAMGKHMSENGFSHAEMLLKHIDNLDNEIACLNSALVKVTNEKAELVEKYGHQESNDSKNQMQQMATMNDTLARLRCDNSKMMPQVRTLVKTEIASAMRSSNNTYMVSLDRLKEDMAKIKCEIEEMKKTKNIEPIKEENRRNEEKINTVTKEVTIRETMLDWKVHNFSHIHEATSPVFYSHRGGYKMSLSLEKKVKGFLSIFAQLRCGEFDGELPWPMRKCITIRIVDQEKFTRHYDRVVIFGDKAADICNRKYNFETGEFGHSKFIAYDELKLKTYLVKVNKMVIQCFVEDLKA